MLQLPKIVAISAIAFACAEFADAQDNLLNFVEAHTVGGPAAGGLNGPSDIVLVSGELEIFAYVVADTGNTLAVFRLDMQRKGFPTFVQVLNDSEAQPLSGACAVAASQDGNHIYAVAADDKSISTFERDSETGELQLVDFTNFTAADACNVAVSPDGEHVYVVSETDSAIVTFERDTNSGSLTRLGTIIDGDVGAANIQGIKAIAVSPDGLFAVGAAFGEDKVVTFERDPSSGTLTQVSTTSKGQNIVGALEGVCDIAFSSDGGFVFAASDAGAAIASFAFSDTEPHLTLSDSQSIEADEDVKLTGPKRIVLSSTRSSAYVTTDGDGSGQFSQYDFDATTGLFTSNSDINPWPTPKGLAELDGVIAVLSHEESAIVTFSECDSCERAYPPGSRLIEGERYRRGFRNTQRLTISPDGRYLFTRSEVDESITVWTRNVATGRLSDAPIWIETGEFAADSSGSLILSPDGRNLYSGGRGIAAFDVDVDGGTLTSIEGVESNLSIDPLLNESGTRIIGRGQDSLIFERDFVTGVLTQTNTHPFSASYGAFGPEGLRLYFVNGGGIRVFDFDESTSELTLLHDSPGPKQIAMGDGGFVFSPDWRHAYHSNRGSFIAAYERSPETGRVSPLQSVGNQGDGGDFIAMSPDGGFITTTHSFDHTLTTYARDRESGFIERIEVIDAEDDNIPELLRPYPIAYSPDGAYVYVGAGDNNAISTFERKPRIKLSGTIREDGSSAPISCAIVELTRVANGDTYVAATSESGEYFFTELPEARFDIRIVAPGFLSLDGGEVDLRNDAVLLATDFEIASATDTIVGTIVDEAGGQAIVGAQVIARVGGEIEGVTYSCARGQFGLALDVSNQLDVVLEISAQGYSLDEVVVQSTPKGRSAQVALARLESPNSRIIGFVFGVDGTPLANTMVSVVGPMNLATTTTESGLFDFVVPEGSYTILASDSGLPTLSAFRFVADGETATKAFFFGDEVEVPICLPGDVDCDGGTDATDIQRVILAVLGDILQGPGPDINGDGVVNSVDIQLAINVVLGI